MKLSPKKIKRKIRKILIKINLIEDNTPKDFYIAKISKKAPWVYVAYIADSFYHKSDDTYFSSHQNKRESLAQVDVFNELGYNVYVQDYTSARPLPKIKFDIVFGHEPNFVRAAIANPSALKIHYVPGAYIEHRNAQIIRMTDYFNKTYKATVPYRRLLEYDNPDRSALKAYDVADEILLIGSKFTVETFPENIQNKITIIHQSTQKIDLDEVVKVSSLNDFFFMGSFGNLLKGISLLIEFFSKHTEYTLHIVGPIESDVKEAISGLITDNIKMYGFLDVNSDKMIEIMRKCNFVIYPSGSEGSPGAVLNSMKRGLIPIVTKWSAFDEISDYGFVLDNWNVESIGEGIKWACSLSEDRILELKQKCAQYIERTYTLDNYKKEFSEFFKRNIRR